MLESGAATVSRGTEISDRLFGRIGPRGGGPTLMCVAGIHGNEPAGIHALRRVLTALGGREEMMAGELVALAGNLSALTLGQRFVDRDLNRAWTEERLAALRGNGRVDDAVENREQIELLEEIETILRSAKGGVFALDLHTTSGPGGVFSAFTDALPHREFASRFPVPMIFGLEELVDGTLLNLLSDHGLVAITVETGQHDEPAAIDRAEAAIWIAVVASGLLPERLVPEATEARKLLQRDSGHLPRALEMRYKRDVENGDGFVMTPGYLNFQKIERSQVVATDNDGDVAVHEDGRLLMPLYQDQGEDGFFVVREFGPFWMTVSHVMRRLGISRIAHWLPGVHRVEGTDDEVLVDRHVARFFARQLFHLLGFRQMDDSGTRLIMRRRRFDEGRYLRELPEPEPLT
jgi:hypothetical protein